MTVPASDLPRHHLVGDVGGTRVRLAWGDPGTGQIHGVRVTQRRRHATLLHAIRGYLEDAPPHRLERICLAVAGPVVGHRVTLPNTDWIIDGTELSEALGAEVMLVNDFTAQALALPRLAADDVHWLGDPRPKEGGASALVGPGTGLGVAIRTARGEIIPSEGGHVGIAPATPHEVELLRILMDRWDRVSVERVLSGPGLENLYWAQGVLEGLHVSEAPPPLSAREIAVAAAQGERLALTTVRTFFGFLASFAGDLALTVWATGGVYLSGGVIGKLDGLLDAGMFRARFEDKGRFRTFCQDVAVSVLRVPHPGLLGAVQALNGAAAAQPVAVRVAPDAGRRAAARSDA